MLRKESVLVVEDETGIRSLIRLFLIKQGYEVFEAEDGLKAIEIMNREDPDVVLLDIEMPGMNGYEVCKEIRKRSKAPVLFISCKNDSIDKMTGFGVGGDDYITKPFDFHELEARIQALLRRDSWITEEKENLDVIKNGEMLIYADRCEVFISGEQVHLLHKEYQLLLLLAQHPNQVWTSEQLYDHIWGFNSEGTFQTVKVHISNLRRKLNSHSKSIEYIQTVRGFGYKCLTK